MHGPGESGSLGRNLAGDSKVEQLRSSPSLHDDVFGLDVTVNDAMRMCGMKRFGYLRPELRKREGFYRAG